MTIPIMKTAERLWLVGWTRLVIQGHHSLSERGERYAKSSKAIRRCHLAQERYLKANKDE